MQPNNCNMNSWGASDDNSQASLIIALSQSTLSLQSLQQANSYCLLFTYSSKVILALSVRGAGWPWPESPCFRTKSADIKIQYLGIKI